ncbi:MAG: NAD(P)/FAD-dependent oxidoreductase [Rhizobiaceae bacterium]
METFDHVIVGGGIIGASVAYHLMRKGAGSVLLLERNELASAASSQAAGLILQASTKRWKTPLAKLTVDTLEVLEEELSRDAGFHMVGSMRLAASEMHAAELDAMMKDAASQNIPAERPSLTELRKLVPWLDVSNIINVAFFPDDGYADPYLLTLSYADAARARGAIIRVRTNVHNVLVNQKKVVGVLTDNGQIECGTVIDACGVWAALFSEKIGYSLPVAPVRSHYWIAEPDESFGGQQPVTILPDIAAYTRPEVGGLVLGVQEKNSVTFDARKLPEDLSAFSPTQGEEHWEVLADAYSGLEQFFPGIERAQFSSYICGLSSYTPDGEIVLGPVPGASGFYTATGDCGSGITLSAGMGDVIADLALGRTPRFDIERFRPDRFGRVDPHSDHFRELCAAARATKLSGSTRLRDGA